MERQEDPRNPRSTKDDLLNELRGVEDPNRARPVTDDDAPGTEAITVGPGALGGSGVGMAVGGPSGALGGGAAGALATDGGDRGDSTEEELEAERRPKNPDR